MLTEAGAEPTPQSEAARDGQTALDREQVLRLFADLSSAQALLLAVSGGPDSMALLLMAARWRELLGAAAPPIHVATVDHGLRAESHTEAAGVAAIAADLDLPHAILTWAGPKPSTRLQERARDARYVLLTAHAQAVGASHILTAHHADDQAETVLMRLARGSGIAGLAGMRRSITLSPDILLVRPLLEVTKADLIALCRAEACAYVDDASNHDPIFARTRLRARRRALASLGLDTPALLRLARRMARADAAIEAETDRVESLLRPERTPLSYRVDLADTIALREEVAVRLLGRAVAHVAGGRAVRLERLERLADGTRRALHQGNVHHGTIAGTRVVLDRDSILSVTMAPPRRSAVQATT